MNAGFFGLQNLHQALPGLFGLAKDSGSSVLEAAGEGDNKANFRIALWTVAGEKKLPCFTRSLLPNMHHQLANEPSETAYHFNTFLITPEEKLAIRARETKALCNLTAPEFEFVKGLRNTNTDTLFLDCGAGPEANMEASSDTALSDHHPLRRASGPNVANGLGGAVRAAEGVAQGASYGRANVAEMEGTNSGLEDVRVEVSEIVRSIFEKSEKAATIPAERKGEYGLHDVTGKVEKLGNGQGSVIGLKSNTIELEHFRGRSAPYLETASCVNEKEGMSQWGALWPEDLAGLRPEAYKSELGVGGVKGPEGNPQGLPLTSDRTDMHPAKGDSYYDNRSPRFGGEPQDIEKSTDFPETNKNSAILSAKIGFGPDSNGDKSLNILNRNASKEIEKTGVDNRSGDLLVSNGQSPPKSGDTALSVSETNGSVKPFEREMASQIVEKAVLKLKTGETEVKIDLKPELLGHLKLKISTDNQQVMLRIIAEMPMTKAIIENNVIQLKSALQNHGLEINTFDVSLAAESDQNDHSYANFYSEMLMEPPGGEQNRPPCKEEGEGVTVAMAQESDASIVDFFA